MEDEIKRKEHNKYVNDFSKEHYYCLTIALKPDIYDKYMEVRRESGITRQEFFNLTFNTLKENSNNSKYYKKEKVKTPEELFIEKMYDMYGKPKRKRLQK